jgi:hypothetical protein
VSGPDVDIEPTALLDLLRETLGLPVTATRASLLSAVDALRITSVAHGSALKTLAMQAGVNLPTLESGVPESLQEFDGAVARIRRILADARTPTAADSALSEIAMMFDEVRYADGEPSPDEVVDAVRRQLARTAGAEATAPPAARPMPPDVQTAVDAGITGGLMRAAAQLLPANDWPDTSEKDRYEWSARVRVVRQLLGMATGTTPGEASDG